MIGEGLVDDGLDERQVRGGLDPADLDPVRHGPRVHLDRKVYLHVPEMPDQVQARGQEQVRRGRVTRVDHMTETAGRKPVRQAGGPLLGHAHQGGTDAAPPVPWVNDTPAVDRARFLGHGLHVTGNRARAVGHHPGVGSQAEARPAPLVPEEARVQHNRPALGKLIGDQNVGHRVEVARFRRPELVSSGEFHGPESTGRWAPRHLLYGPPGPLGIYGAL